MPTVDELDRRIAAALQINARASWQQVAHVVGSSESTVTRRAQRMISSREIRVVTIADPIRCGFGYPVLVQLKCEVGASSRVAHALAESCLLYTSPSPRDRQKSRMPSSA